MLKIYKNNIYLFIVIPFVNCSFCKCKSMTVIDGGGVIRGFESSSFKLFAITNWNVFLFLFPRPNCEHNVSDVSVRVFLCTTSTASLYESVVTNYFINCLYIVVVRL